MIWYCRATALEHVWARKQNDDRLAIIAFPNDRSEDSLVMPVNGGLFRRRITLS